MLEGLGRGGYVLEHEGRATEWTRVPGYIAVHYTVEPHLMAGRNPLHITIDDVLKDRPTTIMLTDFDTGKSAILVMSSTDLYQDKNGNRNPDRSGKIGAYLGGLIAFGGALPLNWYIINTLISNESDSANYILLPLYIPFLGGSILLSSALVGAGVGYCIERGVRTAYRTVKKLV